MFEEVVNRPSRWRVFWPDVGDPSGAQEAIRLGVWFACLGAGVSAVVMLMSAITGGNGFPHLVNVVFFGFVGFGVHREWRPAAVLGAAVVGIGVAEALSRGALPGVITPFILVGLVNGVRGTFAAKRLRKFAPIETV